MYRYYIAILYNYCMLMQNSLNHLDLTDNDYSDRMLHMTSFFYNADVKGATSVPVIIFIVIVIIIITIANGLEEKSKKDSKSYTFCNI